MKPSAMVAGKAVRAGQAVQAVSPGRRQAARDQQVAELLRPGQSIALLQHLHILTREGQLNQDSRRKLKQVYHLYQFIETLLRELAQSRLAEGAQVAPGLSVADHGAGKSYLGFIV